jgi:hypothetical protein
MKKSQEILKFAYKSGYHATNEGEIISPRGNKLKLKIAKSKDYPYKEFSVCFQNSVYSVNVHRLCAYQKYGDSMFEKGIVVRHLNGDPLDNSLNNIAIGTASDNMMDMPKEQRVRKAYIASKVSQRKDWSEIDASRESGMSYKQLRKIYGVPLSSLSYRYGNGKRKRLSEHELKRLNLS